MAQTSIATEIHQPLDIHRDLASQVAFDLVFAIDRFANADHFIFSEFVDPAFVRNSGLTAYLTRLGMPNSMNIGQSNLNTLLRRYIHARDTRHGKPSSISERPILILSTLKIDRRII